MNLRRGPKEHDVDITINLVSFIDVLLCLVIFFMVSTTFVNKANMSIRLPHSGAEAAAAEKLARVDVSISAQGQIHVNDKVVTEGRPEAIRRALAAATNDPQTTSLSISADARTAHQSVIDVLDAAGRVGLVRISFITDRSGD